MVQLPDHRDFSGSTVNTPLISASGRVDLSTDRAGNDETRNG